ncbi:hypothetical protein CJ255_05710 [Candidatus Viridilinea mediisalina]|uniref:Uncharacterized protein n=1 Tax=Candidatus Viridilinea mediisalina TaxID=2024553 RepID=A0A2A6RLY3_9CHLR|nr:hypothetical protein CJ255_05710 [Candidatus Viridilinea mediisalina]
MIADVDGNLDNGREVVVAGVDGRVYVYRANGQLLWTQTVPIAGCASTDINGHPIQSLIYGSPTVGELFGDGVPYVLIGYGTLQNTNRACDGGIVVYRGTDGHMLWNFSQRDFDATSLDGPEALYGVITAPALADSNGDGKLEIAFGGLDRNVYLLNADGSLRWYYHAADTVWSTPLFMNIDDDPELELIVATDISANPHVIPPTHDGGYLQAFKTTPVEGGRIPFQTGFIWRTSFDQVLYSSPLAADLLPDNPGLEIAVGSGCFFPEDSNDKRGRWIQIIRPADGAILQTLSAPACVQSSPAVADLNGNGRLEIVATVSGAPEIGGDGFSRVVAWDPTNPNPKWQTILRDPNSGSNDPHGGDRQSVVIADLDGNGSLEVVAANFWSVHILEGTTGNPLTCQGPGCASQPSLFAWYTLKSTPAIGDLTGNGKLEVVIGGSHSFNSSHGHLYAWTDFADRLNSSPGPHAPYSAPWPQFRRDAHASGMFSTPSMAVSPQESHVLVSCERPRSITFDISFTDTRAVDWRVASVNPATNLITPVKEGNSRLRVDVDGCAQPSGTYTKNIELQAEGLSNVSISLNIRVVDEIFMVALPLVVR